MLLPFDSFMLAWDTCRRRTHLRPRHFLLRITDMP